MASCPLLRWKRSMHVICMWGPLPALTACARMPRTDALRAPRASAGGRAEPRMPRAERTCAARACALRHGRHAPLPHHLRACMPLPGGPRSAAPRRHCAGAAGPLPGRCRAAWVRRRRNLVSHIEAMRTFTLDTIKPPRAARARGPTGAREVGRRRRRSSSNTRSKSKRRRRRGEGGEEEKEEQKRSRTRSRRRMRTRGARRRGGTRMRRK